MTRQSLQYSGLDGVSRPAFKHTRWTADVWRSDTLSLRDGGNSLACSTTRRTRLRGAGCALLRHSDDPFRGAFRNSYTLGAETINRSAGIFRTVLMNGSSNVNHSGNLVGRCGRNYIHRPHAPRGHGKLTDQQLSFQSWRNSGYP
jgi:hypothetical protein